MAEPDRRSGGPDARGEPAQPVAVDEQAVPAGGANGLPTAEAMGRRQREFARLRQVIENINRGVRLEEVLSFIFDEFRDIIPYNRIAFAALDQGSSRLVARWARSDAVPQITQGYSLPLTETSLAAIIETRRPRIINDLAAYLQQRPQSEGTRKLLAEGLRSSLTCPLVIEGTTVGFLFFNSQQVGAYVDAHVEFFMQVAGVVSVVVERGRMFSELAEQKETIERQNRLLADENRRSQAELEMARKVQECLIPRQLPLCAAVRLGMLYEPAELIGGDLLDIVCLAGGRTLVYVADAMGHGVPAALLMSVVRTAFQGAIGQVPPGQEPSPGALLEEVNRMVIELFESNYVTAACGLIDGPGRRMTVSLAGHPPILLRRSGTGQVEEVREGGIPLGIEKGLRYPQAEVALGPGDLVFLYTDGVIEAPGPDGTRYGMAALHAFLARAGDRPVQELIDLLRDDLGRHCGCAQLDDDMTVLAARFDPSIA